jgi:sulfide:quinone oxidoreductase
MAVAPMLSHMSEHRILVAGGGVAGLEAVLALRSLGGDRVAPVLASPQTAFSFRALQVAEPFAAEAPPRFAVADVLAGLDVPQVCDAVVRVDPERRMALTAQGSTLEYDAMLLALGGTPFPVYANGITFDRPSDPEPFEELLADVEAGLASEVVFVIPDTRGWSLPAYDLALLLRGWSRRNSVSVGIRVVTAEDAPLQAFGPGVVAEVRAVLDRAEVGVVTGSSPVVVSDGALLAGSHWLTADRIVSLPGLAGPRLRGVPCDWEGFIVTGPEGAVPDCPGVYAVGDGAAHARKQGGLAAQQADVAARAILRGAGVPVPPADENPVLRGALATPEGPLFLQSASGYGRSGSGSIASFVPLWDPPTKVATRWLGPHLEGLAQRRTRAFAA